MNRALTQTLAAMVGLLFSIPATAQLAATNDAGITMGHIHLVVKDVEYQKKFWTTLGGVPVQHGPLELIQFPGVFVMLRKGEPSGGSIGSTINHFGFNVRDIADVRARIASFLSSTRSNDRAQMMAIGPDDIQIEFIEDPALPTPIALEHVHLFVPAPGDTAKWYAKLVDGVPGKSRWDTVNLPGTELRISKSETAPAGSKGRAIDHVGFEVTSLEKFSKVLEAEGLKFDAPPRSIPNTNLRVAFFTDPWGTYVEITEHLSPPK